jgi:hypothetical protein
MPVEIPDRQPVGQRIDFSVVSGLGAQRVEIRHQMSADAESVDQPGDCRALDDIDGEFRSGGSRSLVRRPLDAGVGNVECLENLVVKVLVAIEQRLHGAEKETGFGALNNAVIVGTGHRHHFADAERCDDVGGHAAIFRRVIHRAHGDDGALSGH